MSKLSSTPPTDAEDQVSAPAGPLNPAIAKAIALYLDTYPDPLKNKILAMLEASQSPAQKNKQP
jgi:hypothetical protein